MTLTEQWKKGELPSGWYYTELWKGCNVIDKFIGNQFLRYDDSDIVEVIASVPSYEEWQATNEENKNLYKMLDVLNRQLDSLLKEDNENQQLKELLKECMTMFVKMYETNTINSVFIGLYENIKTKINAAIGESEE